MRVNTWILRAWLLGSIGCGLPVREATLDANIPTNTTTGGGIVTDKPDVNDAFVLSSLKLNGDLITIAATYQGGCEEHFWFLFWDQQLEGANPAVATLEFLHDARNEPCMTPLAVQQSFDLGLIRTVYQQRFSVSTGTVTLKVLNQEVVYSF